MYFNLLIFIGLANSVLANAINLDFIRHASKIGQNTSASAWFLNNQEDSSILVFRSQHDSICKNTIFLVSQNHSDPAMLGSHLQRQILANYNELHLVSDNDTRIVLVHQLYLQIFELPPDRTPSLDQILFFDKNSEKTNQSNEYHLLNHLLLDYARGSDKIAIVYLKPFAQNETKAHIRYSQLFVHMPESSYQHQEQNLLHEIEIRGYIAELPNLSAHSFHHLGSLGAKLTLAIEASLSQMPNLKKKPSYNPLERIIDKIKYLFSK